MAGSLVGIILLCGVLSRASLAQPNITSLSLTLGTVSASNLPPESVHGMMRQVTKNTLI